MLDKIEQRVVDDIAKYGWHLLSVMAGETSPAFVYSIGMMQTLNHPEIIIFGLEVKLMARLINTIGDEIKGGRPFDEPGLYEGLLEHYAIRMRPVAETSFKNYLGYAMWHRKYLGHPGTLKAMQFLWPDKAGLFPDEEGCDANIAKLQPLL